MEQSHLNPLAPASNGTTNKRPRASRQTQGYPRKRSMKACKTCRLRKTKCNNERPTCAFCRSLNAVCDYEDEGDVSTLDPASQVIFYKLEELSAKLDESILQSKRDHQDLRAQLDGGNRVQNHSSDSPGSTHEQNNQILENELFTPVFCTAPDAILKWPILQDHHNYDESHISNTLFDQQYTDYSVTPTTGGSNITSPLGTFDEDAAPRLVELFLKNMHTENPVLDIEDIRIAAQRVASNGCGWNASSCLIMTISALGAISQSYGTNMVRSPDALAQSHSFYQAARRRVGILEPNLLSVQCLFFLGMYELHISKPLDAWKWFLQASSFLLLHLKAKTAYLRRNPSYAQVPDVERLEASLYWSCYKAMCDLRAELPLPPSPLAEVDYPHVLPPPPTNFDSTMGFDLQSPAVFAPYNARLPKLPPQYRATMSGTHSVITPVLEETWLFYMTDIILSRLKNRILRTLYGEGHTVWNPSNLFSLLRSVNEFECKLEHWYRDLPPSLKFDSTTFAQRTHLHHLTQSLSLTLRLTLFTPMLYYLIHHSSSSFPPPAFIAPPPGESDNFLHLPNLSSEEVEGQIRDFASKAVEAAMGIVKVGSLSGGGGLEWRLERRLLTATLVLLATANGGVHVQDQQRLYAVIRKADEVLKDILSREDGKGKVDLTKGQEAIAALLKDVHV